MNRAVNRRNQKKLIVMMVLVILACALYMLVNVKFGNEKLFWYAMKIRTPKLIVMLITAFAIGGVPVYYQQYYCDTMSAWNEFSVHGHTHCGCVCRRLRKCFSCQSKCCICGGSCIDGRNRDRYLQLSV